MDRPGGRPRHGPPTRGQRRNGAVRQRPHHARGASVGRGLRAPARHVPDRAPNVLGLSAAFRVTRPMAQTPGGGRHWAPLMDGILLQTTRSIRALIGIATEGAPAEEVDLAYQALLDQCAAAEREALRTPPDPIARFDARAAAVLSA